MIEGMARTDLSALEVEFLTQAKTVQKRVIFDWSPHSLHVLSSTDASDEGAGGGAIQLWQGADSPG